MKQLFSDSNLSIKMLRFHLLISYQIWLDHLIEYWPYTVVDLCAEYSYLFFRTWLVLLLILPYFSSGGCDTCKSTGKDNVWSWGTTNFQKDALVLHESSHQHESAVHATSLRKKHLLELAFGNRYVYNFIFHALCIYHVRKTVFMPAGSLHFTDFSGSWKISDAM